jgi:hypothetical protein
MLRPVYSDIEGTYQIEELASRYTAQICFICVSYIWTKEAEMSILDIRNDRRAIQNASKKFSQILNRLLTMLTKSKWNNLDKPLLNVHRLRLESMVNVGTKLIFRPVVVTSLTLFFCVLSSFVHI